MIGNDMKLYYKSSLFVATPTAPIGTSGATLITAARDVTLNAQPGEADISTRGSVWEKREPTLLDGSISFEMVYSTTDTTVQTLVAACLARTAVALACLDGLIDDAASQGLAGNFYLFGLSRNEPLKDAVTISLEAKPADDYVDYIGVGS